MIEAVNVLFVELSVGGGDDPARPRMWVSGQAAGRRWFTLSVSLWLVRQQLMFPELWICYTLQNRPRLGTLNHQTVPHLGPGGSQPRIQWTVNCCLRSERRLCHSLTDPLMLTDWRSALGPVARFV
ncbi:hypothetical protein RRG08_020017 [Elysia crispata]|uniref:Uncharacterized protein n=1 Tax=Elysia crispata TaxID=231223 RepID=A0AAE1BCC0_9GAST|nr:hypothetical protein RRG08_020017 [Elysia crispata]